MMRLHWFDDHIVINVNHAKQTKQKRSKPGWYIFSTASQIEFADIV